MTNTTTQVTNTPSSSIISQVVTAESNPAVIQAATAALTSATKGGFATSEFSGLMAALLANVVLALEVLPDVVAHPWAIWVMVGGAFIMVVAVLYGLSRFLLKQQSIKMGSLLLQAYAVVRQVENANPAHLQLPEVSPALATTITSALDTLQLPGTSSVKPAAATTNTITHADGATTTITTTPAATA